MRPGDRGRADPPGSASWCWRPARAAHRWRTSCYEADKIGLLRLHVRIDERTAGFLALGMAKASGTPVPVVTTSGTAAANLHPAVLEAWHSQQPLIAITADRPRTAGHTGANQTTDQDSSSAARPRVSATMTDRPPTRATWRFEIARLLARRPPGPQRAARSGASQRRALRAAGATARPDPLAVANLVVTAAARRCADRCPPARRP